VCINKNYFKGVDKFLSLSIGKQNIYTGSEEGESGVLE
jgi:hypothetical protein